MIEWITPWLVEVGSWMFGGLVALNLVVIAALLTVGPVDRAVMIGVAAFFASEREAFTRRRTRTALAYVVVVAALSVGLTLAGLVASLWHMAPWVAGAFATTVTVGFVVLAAVVVHSLPAWCGPLPSAFGRR